jgi:uncharacterized protein involved in exopolysaccharide biosynthesis
MSDLKENSKKRPEIDFIDACLIVWAERRTAVIVGLLPLIASIIMAVLSTPIYRAEILLIPANAKDGAEVASNISGQIGGFASLAGISLGGGDDRKNEAIATLKSRTLTNAFVSDNNLLPILFEKQWDSNLGRWKENLSRVPTLWDAYKKIDQIRRLDEDKKTGLLKLSVEWKSAELSAKWADYIVKRTNQHLRAKAIERADQNISFLRKQLNETSIVEVRQALYRLIESELKTVMLAQSSEEYAFRIIDPAVVPEEKIWPKRLLLIILGGLSGLFLGVLSALLIGIFGIRRRSAA